MSVTFAVRSLNRRITLKRSYFRKGMVLVGAEVQYDKDDDDALVWFALVWFGLVWFIQQATACHVDKPLLRLLIYLPPVIRSDLM